MRILAFQQEGECSYRVQDFKDSLTIPPTCVPHVRIHHGISVHLLVMATEEPASCKGLRRQRVPSSERWTAEISLTACRVCALHARNVLYSSSQSTTAAQYGSRVDSAMRMATCDINSARAHGTMHVVHEVSAQRELSAEAMSSIQVQGLSRPMDVLRTRSACVGNKAPQPLRAVWSCRRETGKESSIVDDRRAQARCVARNRCLMVPVVTAQPGIACLASLGWSFDLHRCLCQPRR